MYVYEQAAERRRELIEQGYRLQRPCGRLEFARRDQNIKVWRRLNPPKFLDIEHQLEADPKAVLLLESAL